MRRFLTIFLSLVLLNAYSQLTIDASLTANEIASRLEGNGVEISNVSVFCPYEMAPHRPYGYFEDNTGTTGLKKGLIMTNGAAINALGPNNNPSIKQENSGINYNDPALEDLLNPGEILRDPCVIEFDIVIASDVLTFNYVFASEEYPEYLKYNDVFGFFISGPGIVGERNLAVIPNTQTPVSVSNINQNVNTQYYISNGTGTTPNINKYLQYDGYTVPLRARTTVTPCEKYHIRLAIADVNDNIFDSGVFIEEKSFRSDNVPLIRVEYEHPRFPYAIEGCNDAKIIFKRLEKNISVDATYSIKFSGTATRNLDYENVPNEITIKAFEDSAFFWLKPIADAVDDPFETVTIILEGLCDSQKNLDTITFQIREYFDYELDDILKCGEDPIVLNRTAILTDSMLWDSSAYLSCFQCFSPLASNTESEVFHFKVWDKISGCRSIDSVKIDYFDIKADFDFEFDYCQTTLDVLFENKSELAESYYWIFGDGEFSEEENPYHEYLAALNQTEPQNFDITLIAKSTNPVCADSATKTITILEPLNFPNVFSPNGDGINDQFKISGINPECWHLEVYNRWGKKVVDDNPHTDLNWGEKLTDGVYFYTLKSLSDDRTYKGYFEVLK